MPTLRRYCRVSKYTVLECRIYLDNPLDLNWLLSPRYKILPRVFASIKPLVFPKLREEQERARAKGKKVAAVKDVVVEDDFEVSLFLTNSGTRHTIMTKRKTLRTAPGRIFSNSSKLTGDRQSVQVEIRRESTEESPGISLNDVPAVPATRIVVPDNDTHDELEFQGARRSTRSRSKKRKSPTPAPGTGDGSGDGGSSDSDSDPYAPPPKRQKTPIIIADADSLSTDNSEAEDDDKKKLGLETEYEGFNIHSRILCVVVKRRGNVGKRAGAAAPVVKGKVMEEWISMSQAIKDGDSGDVE